VKTVMTFQPPPTPDQVGKEVELPCGSWWRPTGGATQLGVWARPPALLSPWREQGVVVCVGPRRACEGSVGQV